MPHRIQFSASASTSPYRSASSPAQLIEDYLERPIDPGRSNLLLLGIDIVAVNEAIAHLPPCGCDPVELPHMGAGDDGFRTGVASPINMLAACTLASKALR